jgi:hypothetical protein
VVVNFPRRGFSAGDLIRLRVVEVKAHSLWADTPPPAGISADPEPFAGAL